MCRILLILILGLGQQGQKPLSKESEKDHKQPITQESAQDQSARPVTFQPNVQSDNSQNKSNSPNEESKNWLYRTYLISGPLAFVAAAAAAILVWRQTVTLRSIERAWVAFLLPEKPLVQELLNGQPHGFRVVGLIKNVGSTPAAVIKKFHFKSVVKREENLDLKPPYLEIDESQTEYQMIPESVEPAVVRIDEGEMANISAGNLKLHILGQVIYKDAFGKIHETRYCFRYYPEETADRQTGFYPDGPVIYLKVT